MALLRSKLVAVTALMALQTMSTYPAPPVAPPNEYALKSVFLYNFCHFIEWPESAFTSPDAPLVIGIFGDDPFGSLLKEAVEGETYHNRPIVIEHYRSPKEIKHCHLLFIGRAEGGRLDAVLGAVASQSVLTVGETEDFLDRGGMIALPADRNRVRLRVKPSAMRAARLSVSSKLLRVADVES
ncbi:MAG TPA: YfiR family protein, partial [Chthoniobacterales bacterium]